MEDVIFMKMKNDLSFMIGNTLNLYEHQSTWNPNMPLRGLLYFAQQFEGLLASRDDDLYGTRRVELPTPVYIVFYNGSGMRREEAVHTAIDTCIEKGILKDILVKQKAEVLHMILTEYDEKKHFRTLFREGKEEGKEEGREELLRELVKKKLDKGKTIAEIAEDLEEEVSVIERMMP